jgi:EmrB/QacA subfamily drug resistance transporter
MVVTTQLPTTSAESGTEARRPRGPAISPQRAAAVVFAIGMFMSIMDSQIVNVALATLGRQFHAETSQVQWVVTGYLLSLAICIPASGWLGDRYGTKRVYLIAITVFTVASGLCAASTSLTELIIMRVLQGFGGGMMTPIGQAVLYRAYPPSERVKVARSISRVTVLAPSTAPIIGGLLVTRLSWHWIFLVNIPIGLVQLAFAWRYLEEYRSPEQGRLDWQGGILGGGGLALLLYSLSEGPDSGWLSPRVLLTGVLGVAGMTTFSRRELRLEHPILRLRLLSDRMFRRACGIVSGATIIFFGTLVFTALYLQQARGYSAIQSGLTTFPAAIGIGFSSQIVSRLYPIIGPRRLMITGFTGLGAITFLLSTNTGGTSLWAVRVMMFALGAFMPMVMMPTQASAFSRISHADTGHASAIFTTVQRSASAFGIAILTTVLDGSGGGGIKPAPTDFRWVYISAIGVAAIGIAIAIGVHDSDAAATMVRKNKGSPAVRSEDAAAQNAVLDLD